MVRVDYNSKTGRFVITCPFHLNSIVKSLPNRKWDKKSKTWNAPAIRTNIEYISRRYPESMCKMSDDAKQVIESSLSKYKDFVKGARAPGLPEFPSWYPFKTKPRAKQLEALQKVYGLKSLALFMDMRTGKTKVVIDLASAMRMQSMVHKVVIVCPSSVRRNWVDEIGIHAPFEVDVYALDSSKPKQFDAWMAKKHDFKWLIVGVESLSAGSAVKYVEKFMLSDTSVMMAVDESQSIKGHNSTRSERAVSLGKLAAYRVIMTGTPIADNPLDLFMQFEFLDPDIIGLGDYYSFRSRYAVMGGFGDKQIIGFQNLEELTEIIEPFIFQVRKNEVFPDAPDTIYIKREVELNPAQKELYKTLKKTSKVVFDGTETSVQNTLEKMLRLQEITAGIITYNREIEPGKVERIKQRIEGTNPKMDELIAVTEEYPGPTLVWCVYVDEIKMAVEALSKRYGSDQVVEIHGAISEEQRHINVKELFQGGKVRFLVGNPQTGGVGLTMSTAENEIYCSNSFKYIDRVQSEERGFGPDKKKGTIVVDIVAIGTVDREILSALGQKKSVSEYVRESIRTLKDNIFGDIG